MASSLAVDHLELAYCGVIGSKWGARSAGAARRSFTSIFTCLVSIFFVLEVGFALAQQQTATFDVSTTIAPACRISYTNSSLNFGELSQPGSANLSIPFSCNSNFSFVFSSRHGGLVTHTWTPVPSPFVSLVPYNLSYNIGTDQGFLVDTCSSSNMVGQASTCRGASTLGAAAINRTVTLSFSWNLVGRYPIAGNYRDTLTFSVNAGL